MNPGDIYHFKDFRFPDGQRADKFLIILNYSNDPNVPVLVCKTTSQPGRKPTTRGCHHDHGSFLIPAKTEWFPKDTWAVFYEGLISLFRQEFLNAVNVDQAEKIGTLSQHTVNSLINCVSKSGFVDEADIDLLSTRRNRRRIRSKKRKPR